MIDSRILVLAYGSLMALAFVGSCVLGEDSWMAYLLLIPGLLILKSMNASQAGSANGEVPRRALLSEILAVGARRLTRIALALVGIFLPAALLIEALEMSDLAMAIVVIPALLLVSLVDREFFGWRNGHDRSSSVPTS